MKKKLKPKVFGSHHLLDEPTFKKIFKTMRITILCFFLGLAQVMAVETYAQMTKLSMKVNNEPLEQVLKFIEDESEFFFLYNRDLIDVEQKVSVLAQDKTIKSILDEVLTGTDISFAVYDRQIVLTNTSVINEMVAQQKSVSGKVTDRNGQPLPGVTVVVKGTTQGTVTNADGNYNIANIPDDAVLQFSFVGMKTKEVAIEGKTLINITMEVDAIGIEEVVSIGYGTRKKADLTGSVVRADIKFFKDQPNTSITQALQGSVPGLSIGAATMAGVDPYLFIRGSNSFSGSSRPLIILDGVIFRGDLVDINTNDIESVDVLKDASAKAIYGSQAANGIIIITSKNGEKNKEPVFNFSSYYAIQNPSNRLTPLNRDEYIAKTGQYYYEKAFLAPDYTQADPTFDPTKYFAHSTTLDGFNNGTNTDWLDLTTQNGSISNTNLSMAGNSNKLNYYLSSEYFKQKGYIKNDQYERISLRSNLENHVTDWMTIGMQTFVTSGDYSGVPANLQTAYLLNPLVEPYNADGSLKKYVLGGLINPLKNLEIDDFDKRLNLFGNFSANFIVPFVKGLSYKINYAVNYRTQRNYQGNSWANNDTGSAYKINDMSQDQTLDNVITYKGQFNKKHIFDATLLYGYEKREGEGTGSSVSNFLSTVLSYNSLESGDTKTRSISSAAWEEYGLYQMARVNYKYSDRYLTTFSIRRDGFSGFGSNKKFGLFPSLALAWVASNEKFVANTLPWVNTLKVRGSYGSSGNRTVGRYATLAKVAADYVYVFGDTGTPAYGKVISALANNDLGWETTTGLNVAIDFGILKNRVSGSIEYYNTDTKDVLFNVNLPQMTGFNSITTNIGKIANQGVEASITSVNVKNTNFTWQTTLNYSKNENKIVSILGRDDNEDGVEDDLIANSLFIGKSVGTIYDYKVIGIYQIGDDLPAGRRPGHYIIEDVNGDGLIKPEDDRQFLGASVAGYRFSLLNTFTYNNWSLSFFINSVQGGKNDYLCDVNPRRASGWYKAGDFSYVNSVKELDFWYPNNPDAKFSVGRYDDPINPNIYKPRSFVRLQDVNLTYKIPVEKLKLGVDALDVFFSGKNLYTWTNWIGTDPETGESFNITAAPVMTGYSLGFNLTF